MTDIFISYKRQEREQARKLAEALGARGYSVWWDAEILPGEQYRAVTLQILESCRAAIVIWSPRSTGSNWVLDEAQRALDRGVLVPVHLEQIAAYPLGFGQVHAHDLVGWAGDPDDAKFLPVLAAIERLTGSRPATPRKAEASAEAEAEIAFWRGVQDSQDPHDLQAYLDRYGEGLFAALAQRKLAALSSQTKKRTRKRAPAAQPERAADGEAPAMQPLLGAAPIAPAAPAPALSLGDAAALGRWELGFIGAVALLAPFLLWPVVNITISGLKVFYPPDHLRLLDITQWRNVFFVAPVLTALGWAYDRGERWIEAQSTKQAARFARYAVLALLAVAYVSFMRTREDYAAHSVAWVAAVLTAVVFARRATPPLRRQIEPMLSKQAGP